MANVARLTDDAMDRFGDYGSVISVSLASPDGVHRSGDLHRTSVRFASALTDLGVVPGDRVAVMIPNAPETTAVYAGIARCGAVILPIMFLLPDAEIARVLEDAEPRVVVTFGELVDKVREASGQVGSVEHIVCLDRPTPPGALDLSELVSGASDDSPIVDRDDSDLALLLYTGGTTGRPKGAMLTHGNLAFAGERTARVSMSDNGITSDDVTCSALPLAHSYGVLVWLAGTFIGGRSVLMRWFEPAAFLRCVEEYRCTVAPLVPTMMTYLLNHPDRGERDLSSLRVVNSGAAPLPVEVGRAFEERYGCLVLEGWGLTETVGFGTMNRVDERRWGSIGRPGPEVELTIRHPETDEEMPGGDLGEICMRGRHVMAGYWNLPDASDEALRGGWLHTGDVGYVDPDGFVFIVDRVDDLILRGGFNVYPRDVEEVLQRHPAVLEAAVVGVPEQTMGEEIKAFVVLRPGSSASEDEILMHCREHLARYKTPRAVTFLDSLPKSGVGKVLRRELRDAAAAGRV